MGSSSTKLPRLSFSTADVPAAERYEHWRASLSQDYELTLPDGEPPESVHNEGEVWAVGPLIVGIGRYSAHALDRPERRVHASAVDHYKLHLRLRGDSTLIEAGDRRIVVPVDAMAITDMARPERVLRPAGESITLFIAREALDELLPRPVDLHGVLLGGVGSVLLADHLKAFVGQVGEMSLPDARLAAGGILGLVAAALLPQVDSLADGQPAQEAPLLRQICRYIDLHLAEQDLSSQKLADVFGLSRATLYRLFEPFEGVRRYVLERRLARVHELLERDGGRRHPLTRLAESHGFSSAAALSRAFRDRFGYAPTTTLPLRAGSTLTEVDRSGGDEFARWMRSLGG